MLVAVLVAATIIENIYGTTFVIDRIYHSVWFIALWVVTAVAAMVYIMRASRRATLVLLHASLVVVLLGAFASFLTSKRGDMAISEDGVPASMFETSDGRLERLPFRLRLVSVDTVCFATGYKAHILADDKKQLTQHWVFQKGL